MRRLAGPLVALPHMKIISPSRATGTCTSMRSPGGEVRVDSRLFATLPIAGKALWSVALPPPYVHNIGSSDLHIIAIEIQDSAAMA